MSEDTQQDSTLKEEANSRLKELLGLITQGEWTAANARCDDPDCECTPFIVDAEGKVIVAETKKQNQQEYEFIALARNRIGPLLEEREQWQSWLQEANEATNHNAVSVQDFTKQLQQAQAEVERVKTLVDRYAGTVMTIEEFRQRAWPKEAEDATA